MYMWSLGSKPPGDSATLGPRRAQSNNSAPSTAKHGTRRPCGWSATNAEKRKRPSARSTNTTHRQKFRSGLQVENSPGFAMRPLPYSMTHLQRPRRLIELRSNEFQPSRKHIGSKSATCLVVSCLCLFFFVIFCHLSVRA